MRYPCGDRAPTMIIETSAASAGGAEGLRHYFLNGAYDEMFRSLDHPRKQYRPLHNLLLNLGPDELRRSKHEADQSFFNQGITFLTTFCLGLLPLPNGKKSSADSPSGSRP